MVFDGIGRISTFDTLRPSFPDRILIVYSPFLRLHQPEDTEPAMPELYAGILGLHAVRRFNFGILI
jgi:hypothetical protein